MILTDTHDEWITDERRYLSEGSMALLAPRAIINRRRHHRQRPVGTGQSPRKPTTQRGTIKLGAQIPGLLVSIRMTAVNG